MQGLDGTHDKRCDSYSRWYGSIDLEQPGKERNIVGPFLLGSVPKGEGALNTSGISSESLVFFVQSCPGQVSHA